MPAGQGKTLLRCSIPTPLHAALMAEAKARRVEVGAVLEGRLDLGPVHAPVGLPMLLQRVEVLGQQQEAMLALLEQLVSAVAGPSREATESGKADIPIATYEDLYRPAAQEPVTATTPASHEPTRKRWLF